MRTPDLSVPGAPCWVELCTSDPDAAAAFYAGLFGWGIVDPGPQFGGYRNFVVDAGPIAGCFRNTPEMCAIDVWSVYLSSSDAAATVDAAVARGADVIVPAMPIHDIGVMAYVSDTANAVVGVWQPGTHHGCAVIGKPGTPVWFELVTRDFHGALRFYREVFAWDVEMVSDSSEFRYATFGCGAGARAGVMDGSTFLPCETPANWHVYFGSEDVDASIALAIDLGGAVVAPAENTPYGRLATMFDVTGAPFYLLGPNT